MTQSIETHAGALDLVGDIPVRLSVEVGSVAMPLTSLLSLAEASVVELDRQADELLDVMANGKLIARGEIVSVGTRYGVRLVEVIGAGNRAGGIDRRA